MVAAARRRNAAAFRAGRVDLRYGEAARLPFADETFNKTYSIHSIYFWANPLAALHEIHRVLIADGCLIVTVLPKQLWNPEHPELAGTPECKPYSGKELKDMLSEAGFSDLQIAADPRRELASNFSVIGRK